MTPTLITQVRRFTRYNDHVAAREAVEATLHGLARLLPKLDATPLSEATGVKVEPPLRIASVDEAEALVAQRLGVSVEEARELLETVVAALPRAIDESLRRRMVQHLPLSLGVLLEAPELLLEGEPPMELDSEDATGDGDRAGQISSP